MLNGLWGWRTILQRAVWSHLIVLLPPLLNHHFGLRSPLAGLVVIVVLWIAILVTTPTFLRLSRPGGLLLAPYILWVSFAALLNFSIWQLNP